MLSYINYINIIIIHMNYNITNVIQKFLIRTLECKKLSKFSD